MIPGHSLGLMQMWRFGFCVVALLATPVAAQSIRYTANAHDPFRHQRAGHHHQRRHPGGLSVGDIEPSRLGPAPAAFLYRCDAPQGFYPYIPMCRIPWRVVPAGPHR